MTPLHNLIDRHRQLMNRLGGCRRLFAYAGLLFVGVGHAALAQQHAVGARYIVLAVANTTIYAALMLWAQHVLGFQQRLDARVRANLRWIQEFEMMIASRNREIMAEIEKLHGDGEEWKR